MSALTDLVADEHKPTAVADGNEVLCLCSPQWLSGWGYTRHVAEVTEAAVRAQIEGETTTEWGVRGRGVTLRFGSESDAREVLAKSVDYRLIRRERTAWTEADR